MKNIIITFFFTAISCLNLNAQEVYNSIRSKALDTVNNPSTQDILKKIDMFQVDALDYLLLKMREEMPDSSTLYLDKQAYALSNFMNLYIRTIIEMQHEPKARTVQVVKLFMDASYSNPLFNDSDKELVYTYFNNQESLTRFSLDTDWQRAFIAASVELKRWKEASSK